MHMRIQLGKQGEEKAANYLTEKGYKIIHRNYKCKIGELDIVALEGKTLVIVEVKTRSNLSFGLPCEAITKEKKRHIQRTLRYYTAIHKLDDLDLRIDVIEVLSMETGTYIHHIKNAF